MLSHIQKKLILFGAGQTGKDVLELFGTESVMFFADNAVETKKIRGIDILSFDQYKAVYENFITIITANVKNTCEIEGQLLSNGIENYFLWKDIINLFNNEEEYDNVHEELSEEKDTWKVQILQMIKDNICLKQDKNSEVEFYLVDSFEISHFLPVYEVLIRKGIKARFVAEPPAINSAGRWFDYQQAIDILSQKDIDYCTLRNPHAKAAFTTQYPRNLKYYCGWKCQMLYGALIMKTTAFQLKKEVAEKFDYIFVHGDLQKDILSQWVPPSNLIDMSYPRYLNKFINKISKDDILEELHIKTKKPIVVYYPTWDEYSSIQEYEAVLGLLKEYVFLISKPHHCLWRYHDKLEALHRCSDLVLDGKYDLCKTISIADCVICDAKSGIVTELAFLNPQIHMLILYYNIDSNDFYVNLDEIADGVKNPSELLYMLKKTLCQDKKVETRKHIIDKLYSPDISAGIKRFTEAISRMIQ